MEIITEAVRNLLFSEDSPTLETSVETEARIAMDRYFNSPNKDPYVAFDYMRNRFAAEVSSDAEASYQVNRKLLEEGFLKSIFAFGHPERGGRQADKVKDLGEVHSPPIEFSTAK